MGNSGKKVNKRRKKCSEMRYKQRERNLTRARERGREGMKGETHEGER